MIRMFVIVILLVTAVSVSGEQRFPPYVKEVKPVYLPPPPKAEPVTATGGGYSFAAPPRQGYTYVLIFRTVIGKR